MKSRYAFLTVDTEALPNRAPDDHINRLILGVHGEHRAGILEMAAIGAEFSAPLVFFVDLCGVWDDREELKPVVQSLIAKKQDVQLHAHPEYLPESFWRAFKLDSKPRYLNEYSEIRTRYIIKPMANILAGFTGTQPTAFRAGSFRWNASTLKALQKMGIRYSFNNSMQAVCQRQCPYSRPSNQPFMWSNGLIEIPITEKHVFSFLDPPWWARLQYPQSAYFRHRKGGLSWLPGSLPKSESPAVFLLHSWSFLRRDKNGYEVYANDRSLSGFRKFLRRLSLDYDVVTCRDLPDILATGGLGPLPVEDIEKAAL